MAAAKRAIDDDKHHYTHPAGLPELREAIAEALRLERLHELFLTFDENALKTDNILGYLWGKLAYGALLFATALTDESIADALEHPQVPAPVYRPGPGGVAGGPRPRTSRRKASTALTRPPLVRMRTRRERLFRRHGGVQPPLRQDALRHLARLSGAQKTHRGGRPVGGRGSPRAGGRSRPRRSRRRSSRSFMTLKTVTAR